MLLKGQKKACLLSSIFREWIPDDWSPFAKCSRTQRLGQFPRPWTKISIISATTACSTRKTIAWTVTFDASVSTKLWECQMMKRFAVSEKRHFLKFSLFRNVNCAEFSLFFRQTPTYFNQIGQIRFQDSSNFDESLRFVRVEPSLVAEL